MNKLYGIEFNQCNYYYDSKIFPSGWLRRMVNGSERKSRRIVGTGIILTQQALAEVDGIHNFIGATQDDCLPANVEQIERSEEEEVDHKETKAIAGVVVGMAENQCRYYNFA